MTVDPSNATQAQSWNGPDGAFWASHADAFERSSAGYDDLLLAAAELTADAVVIDVGCGTGALTRAAAQVATQGRATGLDLSAEMLAVARERAERDGLRQVQFVQADAQIHPFPPAAADVVISRLGVMFFGDPPAAFANLARALKAGGRLAVLVWQPLRDNEWISAVGGALAGGSLPEPPPGAPSPFALGDPELVRRLLEGSGLTDVRIEGASEPVVLGDDVPAATELVLGTAGWLLGDLDEATRAERLAELDRVLTAHASPHGVELASRAWLVRATRP